MQHKSRRLVYGTDLLYYSLEDLAIAYAEHFQIERPPTASYVSKALTCLRDLNLINVEKVIREYLSNY